MLAAIGFVFSEHVNVVSERQTKSTETKTFGAFSKKGLLLVLHRVLDAIAFFSTLGVIPLIHRAHQIAGDATDTFEAHVLA